MYGQEVVAQAQTYLDTGLSASEVGRRLDICHSTISRWARTNRAKGSNATSRVTPFQERDSCNEGECPAVLAMDEVSYAYLLGIYLGDGCIDRLSRCDRLRVFQDPKYPRLAELCLEAMRKVLPASTPGQYRSRTVLVAYVYSQHLRCLFPQMGAGKKHLRSIEMTRWQGGLIEQHPWRFLSGLLHSDGCRSRNIVGGRDYPRWSFANLSPDINHLFQQVATDVGLRYTKGQHSIDTHISRRADVALVDAHVELKS